MTHFISRTALILLAGSALAACTTYQPSGVEPVRPNFPVRQPPPGQAPPPVNEPGVQPGELPPPSAQPTSPVESRPLDPLPSAEPRPGDSYPPPPPPPVIEYETVTRTSATGQVVDADGPPQSYTVESGDTVYGIARRLNTTRDQLAADNNLSAPNYVIRPGQVLKGPSSKTKAYVVVSGDTLYAIARRFNVSGQAIADANEMQVSDVIRPGQRLILPDGFRDTGPITSTVRVPVASSAPAQTPAPRPQPAPTQPAPTSPPPAQAPARTPPVTTPPPARPSPANPAPAPAPTTPPIVSSARTPADAQISQLGRGRFLWPLRGDMLSTFGPKGTGQRNDGINIRARAGETVRAAAAGDVVYAGDQVPGFGNLVLIKHADGWVTAYGHLSRVDVKMQDKIAQGQQIGQAGATGGVSEPQLHFEVRYAPTPQDRARPIDPMLVLPQ